MSGNNKLPSILFLGSQIATGGAQRVLLMQARWFHERGYPCKVAFLYDREGLRDEWQAECPVPLIDLQGWRKNKSLANGFRLIRALGRLYKLLQSERISVIETFTHHPNVLGLPIAWAARVPYRMASHHGRPENLGRLLERVHAWMINQDLTTVMVAVSEQIRQQAIQQEGIRPDKVRVIANGIDFSLTASQNPERRTSLARSLGLEPGGCLVLSVGRLRAPKGHTFLLEAIPGVLDQFPDTIFAIAGEGELRASLEAKAQRLEIAGAVRFLGDVVNVAELLNIADLFVLPSLREGLPLALLEAMTAGLPVIATQVGGVGEVIQNHQNGLLVPPSDPEVLGKAILQLLEDDRLRAQLGQAAKATIAGKFTVDQMCKGYEALFLSSDGMTQ